MGYIGWTTAAMSLLVGDIVDEYEKTPAESVKKIDENTIEVNARTCVDELNDRFELNLPDEEDYDTSAVLYSRAWATYPERANNSSTRT